MLSEMILIYLVIINVIGFLSMGIDKWKAIKGKWRISEGTLFFYAILGGAIGSTIGMYTFRHKTKQVKFKIGLPLLMIVPLLLLFFQQNLS